MFVGIAEPYVRRKTKTPHRFDDRNDTGEVLSPTEELKQGYLEAIDTICSSMQSRYQQPGLTTFIKLESLLLSIVKGQCFADEITYLSKIYTDVDFAAVTLEAEILLNSTNCPQDFAGYKNFFATSSHRCQFANIYLLYQFLLLLPATNATSERAFSTLKRVKTAIRNSMNQSRLVSLMLLHDNKDLTDSLDRQQIIKSFVSCHAYRSRDIAVF